MESNGISLRFQGISLAITTGIILYLVVAEIQKFCSLDQKPNIFTVTPESMARFSSTPAKVELGMTITDFPEFSVTENKFKFTGVIWFSFDPALISLETIEKFSFLRGEIEYKSEPTVTLQGDRLIASYAVRVLFKTNLYYGFFPFEDHALHLVVVNTAVNPGEVIFQSSQNNLVVTNDVYVSGYDYRDHKVTAGYTTIPLGQEELASRPITFPAVLFEMDFFHDSARYIISVLLPLLIVFLIDMFSFCLDQRMDHAALVQLSTQNMVALVAYRFVIEGLSPKVGYPMLADYIFFLFLFNSFVTFVVNCIGPYLSLALKKAISLFHQAAVLSVFIYLFLFWVPC
jgi:hypothetical protein